MIISIYSLLSMRIVCNIRTGSISTVYALLMSLSIPFFNFTVHELILVFLPQLVHADFDGFFLIALFLRHHGKNGIHIKLSRLAQFLHAPGPGQRYSVLKREM